MTQAAPVLASPLERRRHQRVRVALLGRFMLADRREFPCQTIDISPGGVALIAPAAGEIGERVVVYLEQLGRMEGHIARLLDQGFAIATTSTLRKRDKLAAQLTWLANRDALGLPEDRRHERIVPRLAHTVLRTVDGQEHAARIIDVSLSGAAVATAASIAKGTKVAVGRTRGRVTRVFDGGLAVEFLHPLPLSALHEDIEL